MLEIGILFSMLIRRLRRNRYYEACKQLVDKVEYYLRSCSAEEWALDVPAPGTVGSHLCSWTEARGGGPFQE